MLTRQLYRNSKPNLILLHNIGCQTNLQTSSKRTSNSIQPALDYDIYGTSNATLQSDSSQFTDPPRIPHILFARGLER